MDKIGDKIFKEYVLKEYVGRGSWGDVLLVENERGFSFVLRVLGGWANVDTDEIGDFIGVQSNRVVRVIDYGRTIAGETCILMENIGNNLDKLLEQTPKLKESQACLYFREIIKSIGALSEHNLVLNSIRPSEIFISGETLKLECLQFLRVVDMEYGHAESDKIKYNSPEGFTSKFGESASIWSAVVIFYRMLTGKDVFKGKTARHVFKAIMQENPDLSIAPDRYKNFFKECLKKDPKTRINSVDSILTELNEVGKSNIIDIETKNPGSERAWIASESKYKAGDKIFEDYVFKGYLGEGGFGRVYHVENRLGKPFALKVLKKDFWREVEKERQGLELVVKIQSLRLVSMLDYGETVKGEPCILMEYVKDSLEGLLAKEKNLEEDRAVLIFEGVLQGLDVLHSNAIVHRDIKPANLFMMEDIIKIGDFGLARFTSGESASLTAGIGTMKYIAPEMFKDRYGFSVDMWSAAVVFVRILSGHHAFDGQSNPAIMFNILNSPPDFSGISEKYHTFLEKCFQKNPEDRYKDVERMLDAFRATEDTTRKAVPNVDSAPEPAEKPIAKPRYQLRSEPMTGSKDEFEKVLKLDNGRKPLKYVENEYTDNGDGTITDEATGLIWQQGGSDQSMKWAATYKYIDTLNEEKFAGYTDWRLPTIDELASLLGPKKRSNDLYIDPVFSKEQRYCWSADKRSSGSAWYVYFDIGFVLWNHDVASNDYVRAVRS